MHFNFFGFSQNPDSAVKPNVDTIDKNGNS
jgi:hypothetical protein